MRAAFNHVVVYLPDFGIYADATSRFAPFGTIEPDIAGKVVLRAGPDGARLDRVPAG